MSVRTKEEILNAIKERFSDDTSDEVLTFIEDVSDTLDNYETNSNDNTNWKEKYEENDKEWREKYKARFFEPTGKAEEAEPDDIDDDKEDEKSPMTFDELFN